MTVDMNIKDFLELRTKYFEKNSLSILIFASICAFLISFGLEFFFIKFGVFDPLIREYKIITIFKYPAILLLFLIFYKIGLIFSKIEIIAPRLQKTNFDYDFTKLNITDLSKIFIHQGMLSNFYEKEKCLYLNSSSEGLITRYKFKNFKLTFRTKILDHGFGIIIRAKNLENYFMYRINFDRSGISITPHIRKDGLWEPQKLFVEEDSKIKAQENEILIFELTNNNHKTDLNIFRSNKIIKRFEYLYPSFFALMSESNSEGPTPKNIVPKIEWPKYGRVGFRVHGLDERAIIYNLDIEEL